MSSKWHAQVINIHLHVIQISSIFHQHVIQMSYIYHTHVIHKSSTSPPYMLHTTSTCHPHSIHISFTFQPHPRYISTTSKTHLNLSHIFILASYQQILTSVSFHFFKHLKSQQILNSHISIASQERNFVLVSSIRVMLSVMGMI